MSVVCRKLSQLLSEVLMMSRLQAARRERLDADELDILDAGFVAFGDLEDKIDAITWLSAGR